MSGRSGEHPRDLLSAYVDDELIAAERAEVEAHLAACSECRDHLLSLRALSSALRDEPVPPVPAGLEDRIGRRLDEVTVVPFRRRFAIPATIAATIAAIGLVSVVLFEQRLPAPPAAPNRERVFAEEGQLHRSADNDKAKDEKKDQSSNFKLEAPRSDARAKEKTAAAPIPPPPRPAARDELAKNPSPEAGVPGGVVGGAVGGAAPAAPMSQEEARRLSSLGYVGNAPAPAEKQTRAAQAVASPAQTFAGGCGVVTDSAVEGSWLVRDTDEATRRIAVVASQLGGRLVPNNPDQPMTLVVEIPAGRYPSFVAQARAMDVLGLDDVRSVEVAGCVRQRIVLRRVVVN